MEAAKHRKPIRGTFAGCCAWAEEQSAMSMAQRARPKNVFFMTSCGVFAAICTLPTAPCSLSQITSLDDLRTFLVQELVAAIRTEEFDVFVPQLLIVAIELAVTLWAGDPKNFRHG
jgi:hypothetical protein